MKIFLTDQAFNFNQLLKELMTRPVMKYSRQKLREKTSTVELTTAKKLPDVPLSFLFDYKIFPSTIMAFQTQWTLENRKMKAGDTILQQVFIPPAPAFSQKIIFGVRINSIIDEPTRKGFSYETLEGHVEKGESTFTIEETEKGLIFKIQTFSEPATCLTKLLGPLFSLPYQAYCTRTALENVKRQLESAI